MTHIIRPFLALMFVVATVWLASGCSNQGSQNIYPVGGPTYSVAATCTPGTPGCISSGYFHYSGNMGNVNNSIARSMISSMYGVSNWCLGGCYNVSTMDVYVSGGTAQVNINLGGYAVGGQGPVAPTGANGNTIQVFSFGTSSPIGIVSPNVPFNGSFPTMPALPVQYGGQQFATVSLMLQPY